ncbi:MarR family winged helix-turn-helix transcriptional regulator [Psychromicrobium xiongbiense]|uniref:MarR family winged helix-turn-helix transcriptional regulator n=1 Tax=Psychromicrobium xiongbiense TaxID=3051184 RepID=UPI002554027D|nr:MarR family transcriptional regulator [Psychromicrobium sp. YIM S02556]
MPTAENTSADRAASLAADLRVVLAQLNRRLREQAMLGDLTRSQINVLARIERDGPAGRSDLARAEGITPQSMGALIAGLEDRGLVSSLPDPSDGRRALVSLTPHALELFGQGRLAREDWLAQALQAQLTPAEQVELRHSVELLQRLSRF